MTSRSQTNRRQNSGRVPRRTLQPEGQTTATTTTTDNLIRRRGSGSGGFLSVPAAAGLMSTSARTTENAGRSQLQSPSPSQSSKKLTRLLVNVNVERSLGPVQVVVSPENTVKDLIKEVVEIYVKEKRRPLLKETDPMCFQLHYSQFSLESLKADERLINLGSRNFFLCFKPSTTVNSSCSEEAQMATKSQFTLTKLMDFLL